MARTEQSARDELAALGITDPGPALLALYGVNVSQSTLNQQPVTLSKAQVTEGMAKLHAEIAKNSGLANFLPIIEGAASLLLKIPLA